MLSKYHQRLVAIKSRYPRAYEKWTHEDFQLLSSMLFAGKSVEEMSKALQRQPSAIRSKIEKQNFQTLSKTENVSSISEPITQKISEKTEIERQFNNEQLNLNFSLQWRPVLQNATTPYNYPQNITPYMNNRYRWPAVYRWLIVDRNWESPPLLYIGTAKKLCPERLLGYLRPVGTTNLRISGLLREYQNNGFNIRLELLGVTNVKIDSVLNLHFHFRTSTRRLIIEELLIDYYKQQGIELLNQ